MRRIGIISDTHGRLRPEAKAALAGCQRVIHAGDIGSASLLDELTSIAPVTAVRGNNDRGLWASDIPEVQTLHIGDVSIYVLHDLAQLSVDPVAAGIRVVISGHSHKPLIREQAGVLYINPGSAGPRRFKLPVCVAQMLVNNGSVSASLIELKV